MTDVVKLVAIGLAVFAVLVAADKKPEQQQQQRSIHQQKLDYEGWQPINVRQSRDLSSYSNNNQQQPQQQAVVPQTAGGSYYGTSTQGQQTKAAVVKQQINVSSYQAPAPQNTYGSPRPQSAVQQQQRPNQGYSAPQQQQLQPQIQLRSAVVQPRPQKNYRAPLIPAPVVPTSYAVPAPVTRPQPRPQNTYSAPALQNSYSAPAAPAPAPQPSYAVPTPIPAAPQPSYAAPSPIPAPQTSYAAPQNSYSAPTASSTQTGSASAAPQTSYSAPARQPQPSYSAPQQQAQQPQTSYSAPQQQSTFSAPLPTYSAPRQQSQQSVAPRRLPSPTYSAPAARPQQSYSAPAARPQQSYSAPARPLPAQQPQNTYSAPRPAQVQQQQAVNSYVVPTAPAQRPAPSPQQSYSAPQQQQQFAPIQQQQQQQFTPIQQQQPQNTYSAPRPVDLSGQGPVPVPEDIQSQFVSVNLPIAPITEPKKTLPSYPPHDPGHYNQQQQQQQQQILPVPVQQPAENEIAVTQEEQSEEDEDEAEEVQPLAQEQPQVAQIQTNHGGYSQQHNGVKLTEVVNQPNTGAGDQGIEGIQIRNDGFASGSGPASGSAAGVGTAPPRQQHHSTGFGVQHQPALAIDQRIDSLSKNLDILTLARSVGGVDTFLALVQEAGLVETLSGPGPFTVFVPTDEAFGILPSTLELTSDRERLREILLNHVVGSSSGAGVLSTDFTEKETVVTAEGGKSLRVNVYQLAPSTPKILTVNGARILKADAAATNGVIHFVNRVLYPFAEKSITDIMFGCKTFEGISNLLIDTDQLDKLSGPGPFTVFAPSNDAINRVKSTIDDLVQEDKDKATKVMAYHVVNGTYYSEGLFDRQYLVTEIDERIPVSCVVTTDTFFKRLIGVNDVRVTRPDIVATNGVIHLMDGVLDPESALVTCNLL